MRVFFLIHRTVLRLSTLAQQVIKDQVGLIGFHINKKKIIKKMIDKKRLFLYIADTNTLMGK